MTAKTLTERLRQYDPEKRDRVCLDCGHPYHRHFDWAQDWAPVGCKYCPCQIPRLS